MEMYPTNVWVIHKAWRCDKSEFENGRFMNDMYIVCVKERKTNQKGTSRLVFDEGVVVQFLMVTI